MDRFAPLVQRQASVGGHHLQLPGGPRNPDADKWTGGGRGNIVGGGGRENKEAGGSGGASAEITPRAVLWILMVLKRH